MVLKVKFLEQSQEIPCDFGEVHEISDAESYGKGYNDGKKDGYADGYGDGETAGHAAGFEDGKQAGYEEGFQAGEDAGYDKGYDKGYEDGVLKSPAAAQLDALIDKSITEVRSNAKIIGARIFDSCTYLNNVEFPLATSIGLNAFYNCIGLESVYFHSVADIGGYAFSYCTYLSKADFPSATTIGNLAFNQCTHLSIIILRSKTICALLNTRAFQNTPIASGTGYIYVPKSLVDSYKTATNWATYANQIRAIEDYPEICGEVTA